MKVEFGKGAHQQVLSLVNKLGQATVERLWWEVDHGEDHDDYRLTLGPKPRRTALLTALGDLADYHLVETTPEGFTPLADEIPSGINFVQTYEIGVDNR